MRTYLECIPCFLRQSLEAARMATDDEEIQSEVLKQVMTYLTSISFTKSPPEISTEVHRIIRSLTQSEDPYKTIKDASNTKVKNQYAHLKKRVEQAEDPLRTAVQLAIIGNVIDFGTTTRFNVDEYLKDITTKPLDDAAYQQFQKSLDKAHTILYLADNTGEIFFDKILIEELVKQGKQVTYVVRAHPIINDATREDAEFAGIDTIATIIEGDEKQEYSAPGMVLPAASQHFMKLFSSSDMVISKGQGNYEGLSDVERDVTFLLVVKCPLVARDIQSKVGTLLLKVKQ